MCIADQIAQAKPPRLCSKNEMVRVNFGASPFLFNIEVRSLAQTPHVELITVQMVHPHCLAGT